MFRIEPLTVPTKGGERKYKWKTLLAGLMIDVCVWGGGGGKIEKFKKKKKSPKSTLLADNTRGLVTTKQAKPRPVASAAPHPITPTYGGGGARIEY